MAQLKETTVNGNLNVSNAVCLENGKIIYSKNTDGDNRSLIQLNANNQYVYGYGGYVNNEGSSYYDGNELYIRSKGGIYMTSPDAGLTARAYGQNKVLWSGSWYMSSGHTITLNEAISAQPHGVVFVWSAYNNGTVENSNFSYHFVPKHHAKNFNGNGITMHMFNSNWSKAACKYLYVHDTTVTGHDNNTLTGTGATGITYSNNYWVLRYVIGV